MPEREKNPEEQKAELIEELKRCRDEYTDEIPGEIVNSTNDQTAKVRKAWFMLVLGRLDLALEAEILPESIQQDAEEFCEKFSSPDFTERLTTEEDIAEANAMIDKVINEISPEDQ